MFSHLRFLLAITSLLAAATAPNAISQELPEPCRGFDFHRDIRPILEQRCVSCHGAQKPKGDFRLDTREHLLKGGASGVAIELGKSATVR